MAEVDVFIQNLFWVLIIPVIVIVGLCYHFRGQLGKFHKKFFAYLMNKAVPMMNKRLRTKKQRLFRELHDLSLTAVTSKSKTKSNFHIVEIGAGSGANFEFYPDNVIVSCVDPNPYFKSYLQVNGSKYPLIQFRYIEGTAEDMSRIPDNSADAVVATFVLCTVSDAAASLQEVKRILKPGGKFFYLDHVAADEGSFTLKVQRLLKTPWRTFADGCTLTRNTHLFIEKAGFSSVSYDRSWPKGLSNLFFLLKTTLVGTATK